MPVVGAVVYRGTVAVLSYIAEKGIFAAIVMCGFPVLIRQNIEMAACFLAVAKSLLLFRHVAWSRSARI